MTPIVAVSGQSSRPNPGGIVHMRFAPSGWIRYVVNNGFKWCVERERRPSQREDVRLGIAGDAGVPMRRIDPGAREPQERQPDEHEQPDRTRVPGKPLEPGAGRRHRRCGLGDTHGRRRVGRRPHRAQS